jgi:hypothetical protein
MSKPERRRTSESARPARGPAIAKSHMDFEFGGGDFRGVIAPVKAVVMEGIKLGRPISNYSKNHIEIIVTNLSRSIL